MSRTKYFAVVTDVGNALMMQAVAEGKKVSISRFGVGDGNGAYYEPQIDMMQLKNELWRGDINDCQISKESENVLIVSAICPGDVGGFTIREMAVFDEENNMIAICNTPDTPKVKITDGVVNEMRLELEIILINGTSVELVVDPNIVTATKKDVEEVWDYLKETGKVIIGEADAVIEDNDICIVVDEVDWPKEKIYLLLGTAEQATMKSTDGKEWTKYYRATLPPEIVYGKGCFVDIGNNKKSYVSVDGINWNSYDVDLLESGVGNILYKSKYFIATKGAGNIYKSSDGIKWNKTATLDGGSYINFIFAKEKYIAANMRNIFSSSNAEEWSKVKNITSYSEAVLSFANGIFACLHSINMSTYATKITYSPDGVEWKTSEETMVPLKKILAANNIFWGIPRNSQDNKILCSLDATTWNEIEFNGIDTPINTIEGIYFVDNIFYCTQNTNLYISQDGHNWEKVLDDAPRNAKLICNF